MNGRRRFGRLMLGGLAAAVAPARAPRAGRGDSATFTIRMRSSSDGGRAWFDPPGLLVPRGAVLRWLIESSVHTTAAYHPANAGHSLRIPEAAEPWDSGYLVEPGDAFERRFDVPGVYDYFCTPHEAAGMVGRLVVGEAAGPGTLPFDYFQDLQPAPGWLPVPEAARQAFPPVARILAERVVRAPT